MAGLSNIFGGGDDFGAGPEDEAETGAAAESPFDAEASDATDGPDNAAPSDDPEEAGTDHLLGQAGDVDHPVEHPAG